MARLGRRVPPTRQRVFGAHAGSATVSIPVASVTANTRSVSLNISETIAVTAPAATANTNSVTISISETVAVPVATATANTRSVRIPKISITLRDQVGDLLASKSVKYAVLKYDSGNPANTNWMSVEQHGVTATDGSGVLDVVYGGSANSGDTVYLSVISTDSTPEESVIWTAEVT